MVAVMKLTELPLKYISPECGDDRGRVSREFVIAIIL